MCAGGLTWVISFVFASMPFCASTARAPVIIAASRCGAQRRKHLRAGIGGPPGNRGHRVRPGHHRRHRERQHHRRPVPPPLPQPAAPAARRCTSSPGKAGSPDASPTRPTHRRWLPTVIFTVILAHLGLILTGAIRLLDATGLAACGGVPGDLARGVTGLLGVIDLLLWTGGVAFVTAFPTLARGVKPGIGKGAGVQGLQRRRAGRRGGRAPGYRREGPQVPAVMRLATWFMPPAIGRRWLAEVHSCLHEASPQQRPRIRRNYLLTTPRVIAVAWAATLTRGPRAFLRRRKT
jgi:hypothetical protein